ncbi:MAG: protein kinase domain-containing protein, partial [Planctomycetaceae bacterium]
LLGRGGFGEVWRAEAPGGMGVAIKILANLGRREGGREFRALQTIRNIRHAHIVPLFGVWLKTRDGHVLDGGEVAEAERRILAVPTAAAPVADAPAADGLESLELIVAMGLGDQTLFDRLKEARRAGHDGLPAADIIQWMQQAALALDHFNSRSRSGGENLTAVQHCDIKPQNILLVGDAVQVCDFGLARAQGEVRATSNTMASLAYAAPEMVSPPYDPSPTTDQYSLALTYVELRTGRLPYAELSPVAIMRAKIDGGLDLSMLPDAEAAVLGRALAIDATKRFQTCGEFVRALKASAPAAFDTARITAVATAESERSRAPTEPLTGSITRGDALPATGSTAGGAGGVPRGSPRLAAAAAACALVAAALAGWWRGGDPPSSAPLPAVPAGGSETIGPAAHPAVPAATPTPLERAEAAERSGDLPAAAALYARELADQPRRLATVLWDLQTRALDGGRAAEAATILAGLEELFHDHPDLELRGDGAVVARWDVVNTLAWLKATAAEADAASVADARRLAGEAVVLAGADRSKRAQALDTLAAAAAAAGAWEEALQRSDEAIDLADEPTLRAEFVTRRDRYVRRERWIGP